MVEPQSHEWSSPKTGAEGEYKPVKPSGFRSIVWWYLTRICALAPLTLITVLIASRVTDHFYFYSLRNWIHLATRLCPLLAALLLHFLPQPTLRVIAHGASIIAGTLTAIGLFHLIREFADRMPAWLFVLLGIDFIAALFCAYSSGHLTAKFLTELQRKKQFEQGFDPALGVAAGKLTKIGEMPPPGAWLYWLGYLMRVLAVLPIPVFTLAFSWAESWGSIGNFTLSEEMMWCIGAGVVCLVGILSPIKTLRLMAAGVGVWFGIFLVVLNSECLYEYIHIYSRFTNSIFIGEQIMVILAAMTCVGMAVVTIRQTIRVYRPEKIFLPGRDDLNEFDGMGRWDEGGR